MSNFSAEASQKRTAGVQIFASATKDQKMTAN